MRVGLLPHAALLDDPSAEAIHYRSASRWGAGAPKLLPAACPRCAPIACLRCYCRLECPWLPAAEL
eukprot:7491164-Alexandrium_andersonii.AAC.1